MTSKVGLFCVALITAATGTFNAARAQTFDTSASIPVSPLPNQFVGCQINKATQIPAGRKVTYRSCSVPKALEEYGSFFLSFTAPTARALDTAPKSKRNAFLIAMKAFLRFTNPQVRSGSVDLTITSIAPDGTRTPFYIRQLVSFSLDELKGVQITTLTSDANNQIGPRFRIEDGVTFEASLNTRYSSNPQSLITQRAAEIGAAISSFDRGYVESAASAALKPIRDFEKKIAELFKIETPSTDNAPMTFDDGGITGVAYTFRLDPTRDPDGQLFLGMKRQISVLPGEHKVENGKVSFSFIEEDPATVRNTTLIAAKPLVSTVSDLMSPALYAQLMSEDAGQFQQACATLKNSVENSRLNLTAADRLAVRWAFGFSWPNIVNGPLRSGECAADFLATPKLAERGMRVRPEKQVVPTKYDQARTDAQNLESAATQVIDVTNPRILAARSNAISATMNPPPAGTARVTVAGFGTYFGQATTPVAPSVVGTFTRIDPVAVGDTYAGEMVVVPNSIVLSGSGEYVFGNNPGATALANAMGRGPLRRYVGQLLNSQFNGMGRLQWADGAVFSGQFSADKPVHGVLTQPDGTIQYGTFLNGKLDDKGVEVKAQVTRWGSWIDGKLPNPNPIN